VQFGVVSTSHITVRGSGAVFGDSGDNRRTIGKDRTQEGKIMINQLVGEMGKLTQIRQDDHEIMQLTKYILGGLGWTILFLGIGIHLIMYFIFNVVFAGFRN